MRQLRWLPERLVHARKEKGLTHERLARLVGVSRPAVSAWESGTSEPSGKHLVRLAQVLGKPEAYFYGADEPDAGTSCGPGDGQGGKEQPIPAAARPEPATPDWDAPPVSGPAPSLQEILRRIEEQERRIQELERKLGKDR